MYIECLINETNAKDSAGNEADILCDIDRMHKWWPKKYSLVYVLIRLTSLALKQHFFCILYMHTRLVSLISIYTKEYFLAAIYAFGLTINGVRLWATNWRPC